MSAVPARDELHHLVDRLPIHQAERLLRLVESDPELAGYAEALGDAGEPLPRRRLAFAGLGSSGRGDLSERVEELLGEQFTRGS